MKLNALMKKIALAMALVLLVCTGAACAEEDLEAKYSAAQALLENEDYEAAAKSSAAAALDLTGAETKADLSEQHLVLAQVGGCDTALTDSAGANAGNLIVVQMG